MRAFTPIIAQPAGAAASETPTAAPTTARRSLAYPGQDLLADETTAQIVLAAWGGEPAVVVPSPPGSGKTRLTTHLAALLAHRAGLRVGVAAQTRSQAIDIARRLAAICDRRKVGILWKAGGVRPDVDDCPVITNRFQTWPSSGGAVRVATTAKWLVSEPNRVGADVLIVDEAYQCTYANLCALGAMSKNASVVLVGDPGQIAPVVTGDTSRWETSATGPHLPSAQALAAAHRSAVSVIPLKYTWRLGPQTTALVSAAFYSDLPFTSRRPAEALQERGGAVVHELAHRVVAAPNGPTSHSVTEAVVTRVGELLGGAMVLDTAAGERMLVQSDVAVVVPHVAQAAAIRASLGQYQDVLVGTANALQGLERAVAIAVHPMMGKRAPEGFSLDPSRLCVMLSRHRCHLTMLVDGQTEAVLAGHAGDPAAVSASAVLEQICSTSEV